MGDNAAGCAQRRELIAKIGVAQLHHPLGAGQIAQRVSPQIGQPGISRKLIDNQIACGRRQHCLPTVGQIAQPRRPVDRRADVIALVAQLHIAGMHPDAQPDRRQRRPLQLKRARHRISGTRKRDHEAVALALLDRAHTAMGGDDVAQQPV